MLHATLLDHLATYRPGLAKRTQHCALTWWPNARSNVAPSGHVAFVCPGLYRGLAGEVEKVSAERKQDSCCQATMLWPGLANPATVAGRAEIRIVSEVSSQKHFLCRATNAPRKMSQYLGSTISVSDVAAEICPRLSGPGKGKCEGKQAGN